MLKVTKAAKSRLLSKLVGRKASDGEAFRFTRKKGGWKLRLDNAQPNDTVLAFEGRNVLLYDQDVSRTMTHLTLDVTDPDSKPRLTLRTIADGKSPTE
jgi:hypothetical protein